MASKTVIRGSSDSSDDDTVSLTSTAASEQLDVYTLEEVLAEIDFQGESHYLVKWEGYPLVRCTWEKSESFQSEQTLEDWRTRKMRISRGLEEPFDVDTWQRQVDKHLNATARRKQRRREKKIALGLPVADLPSASESSTDGSEPESSDYSRTSKTKHLPDEVVWTAKEETSLLEGLEKLKRPNWDGILELYGPDGIINQNLERRTAQDLCRQALVLKAQFGESGKDFPYSFVTNESETTNSPGKPGHDQKTLRHKPVQRLQMERPRQRNSDEPISSTDHTPRSRENSKSKLEPPLSRRSDTSASVVAEDQTRLQSRPDSGKPTAGGPPPHPSAAKKTRLSPSKPTIPRPPIRSNNAQPQSKSSQLGISGRGPARHGPPTVKSAPKPKVDIFGNWTAEPKQRKSRYDTKPLDDSGTKSTKLFKKFSTGRKYELNGRREREPDKNSLVFINLKDGKVLPKPGTSSAEITAGKPPFQLIQERLGATKNDSVNINHENDTTNLDTNYNNAKIPTIPPDQAKKSTSKRDEVQESTATKVDSEPAKRNSVSFEIYSQRKPSNTQAFTAPVAMMGSSLNQDAKSDQNTGVSSEDHPTKSGAVRTGSSGYPPGKLHEETSSRRKSDTNSMLDRSFTKEHPHRHEVGPVSAPDTGNESTTGLSALLTDHQPQKDGYSLFPLDDNPRGSYNALTNMQDLDVIAEILVGPDAITTEPVIFRGIQDFNLKKRFLSIKELPKRMPVWCKSMCTAGEFAILFHDEPSYLGSGWIVPFRTNVQNVDALSQTLADHASGGLFFADYFVMLIFPANCIIWSFLDKGLPQVPNEASLRFAMLTPWPRPKVNETLDLAIAELKHLTLRRSKPISITVKSQFGLEYSRLVAQPSDPSESKNRASSRFFLIFPPNAQEERDLLVDLIQANGAAEFYLYEDPGAWIYFIEHVENGVIICHESFFDYWAIPNLPYPLRRSTNMFNLSFAPMSSSGPDPHLIRLFPHGMAILFTDSLFLLRALDAARILKWFRLAILPHKPPRTWKVCTRPAVRQWLLKVQGSLTFPNGNDFVACYGEVDRLLPLSLCSQWDLNKPQEGAPIGCMGDSISGFEQTLGTEIVSLEGIDDETLIRNDTVLSQWFAGWAMTKQEKFRRFQIVTGREDTSKQYQALKDLMKAHSHVEVFSFETFCTKQKVWDEAKMKRHEDRERQAKPRQEQGASDIGEKQAESSKTRQEVGERPVQRADKDVEMRDADAAEESLFLPMDESSG